MESSARRPGGATWSTRTTGCYSALKRKDVLTPATTWVNWRPLCCTEQASRRRTNTVGVHAREGSRRVNSTEAGGHQGLGDGARGAVANGDGELVWGDEIVLEMTVVMLRGHVNVLNGPELKRLQTVKTEDFILCVFYHNFYLKKKERRRRKETHKAPVTFAVPMWLCGHWTEKGTRAPRDRRREGGLQFPAGSSSYLALPGRQEGHGCLLAWAGPEAQTAWDSLRSPAPHAIRPQVPPEPPPLSSLCLGAGTASLGIWGACYSGSFWSVP